MRQRATISSATEAAENWFVELRLALADVEAGSQRPLCASFVPTHHTSTCGLLCNPSLPSFLPIRIPRRVP